MKLLIDTHILLWHFEGIKLTSSQVEIIDDACKRNECYVSTISFWEVAMLVSKERIILKSSVQKWAEKVLETRGLNIIESSISVLIKSNELPNFIEGDPVDRIIVATARENDMDIMTFDRRILDYGKDGYVKAFADKELA